MTYLILLRLIHIVCAVFWTGSVLYLAIFIIPAVKALGPDGGKFMQQLSKTNGFPKVMTIVASIAVLAGILLIKELSGGFESSWFGTQHGIMISMGATFAIIAYLIGFTVNRPTVEKMDKIGKAAAAGGGPPSPAQMQELQKLRSKLFMATNIVATLLLCALISMSIVRYF